MPQARGSLTKINQGPLRELIYDQVLQLIVSGQLQPGARLVEAELAAELGTSRIPVREALLSLQRDKWVDLHPRRGAQVHIPEVDEADKVFEVRAALEGESGRLAALRASADDVERLLDLVRAGARLVAAGDHTGATQANSAFHRAVATISGNELLTSLLGGLERRIWWHFNQVATTRGIHSWDEHAAIVAAIAAGDPGRASAAMRGHIEATKAALHSSTHMHAAPAASQITATTKSEAATGAPATRHGQG